MQLLRVPYVGFWVGRVSNVQLAQGQERHFSRQVHLVELHEYFGTHLVRLHNVVKQPESTRLEDTNDQMTCSVHITLIRQQLIKTQTATLLKKKSYPTVLTVR